MKFLGDAKGPSCFEDVCVFPMGATIYIYTSKTDYFWSKQNSCCRTFALFAMRIGNVDVTRENV